MPTVIVEFDQHDIAELLARAATAAVGKDGMVASSTDVVFELSDPGPDQQLFGARVRVRNVSPR